MFDFHYYSNKSFFNNVIIIFKKWRAYEKKYAF